MKIRNAVPVHIPVLKKESVVSVSPIIRVEENCLAVCFLKMQKRLMIGLLLILLRFIHNCIVYFFVKKLYKKEQVIIPALCISLKFEYFLY